MCGTQGRRYADDDKVSTFEDLMEDLARIEKAKAAYLELANAGIGRDHAIILLVNRHRITWGNAADIVRALEDMTGRKLVESGDYETPAGNITGG